VGFLTSVVVGVVGVVGDGVGVTAGVGAGLAVCGGLLAAVFGTGGGDGCVPVAGLLPVLWLLADCEGPAGGVPPVLLLPLLELLLPGFLLSGGFAMVTPLEARYSRD